MPRDNVYLLPEDDAKNERRPWVLHPALIAAFPPLALYSQNPGDVMLWELGASLGVAVGAAILLTMLLRKFYPNWDRAALGASWVVLLVYSFWFTDKINPLLAQFSNLHFSRNICLAMWAVTLLGGLSWLYRSREDDWKFTRFINLFGFAAVVGPCVLLAISVYQRPHQIEWEPLSQPTSEVVELTAPETAPDIYYLEFSGYADDQTLRENFKHDNQPFYDELKRRGFHIADDSRANYLSTDLAAASTLNMRYHEGTIQPKSFYLTQLQDHRVGQLLKEQGYRYQHLGDTPDGLRENPHADSNYRFATMPTEYTDVLLQFTAFYPWFGSTSHRRRALDKFDILSEKSDSTRPKFVYAHFDTPQSPWKFDQEGRRVTADVAHTRGEIANYRNQLIYTNNRILETIDNIVRNSERPPVIILQSQRGPDLNFASEDEIAELAGLRKRSGILTAMYLPGLKGSTTAPATLSPVNTFRFVFREYFNANIELLPDRTYYWERADRLGNPDHTKPCQLVDVTDYLRPNPNRAIVKSSN